ncbi:amino acid/amide ABC transporter ATP-binding protein 1 (HAAT family) [Dongia mobilis]|uniref:Amino acid/amide ABC transporter ATP-binding protein 1 (HAAT family) n=1 Tax=Dongia mobilis TaxID=578943 RepID=A0A4V3DEB7_9PROT|nr:ABC transporter ATP-binding protein [Dongia mobilis]TDQ80651.1 amino acid/amide ABC transporter ATP-binding protein 1 (HAAT family) [Dongia mobilis]
MSFLRTEALSRSFGGLAAVAGVDLSVEPGEIRAIIGPNGAGKTTLVSLISGRVPPSSGRIEFDGDDITALKPWERVLRGIVYTFQITSIFRNLTLAENVMLAAQRAASRDQPLWRGLDDRAVTQAVDAALERVGLASRAQELAGELAYGHQRLLEVAMGLALRPKLLILDEPTQGLSEQEIADFCALVRSIAMDATILLIEHNMDVVMALAQRITVMNNGALLAEGTPDQIMNHAEVQRAYLGT